MIDLSKQASLDWPTWTAARDRSLASTPPEPILISEALRSSFNLDVISGFTYADDVIPIVFDADAKPPPRPVRTVPTAEQLRQRLRTALQVNRDFIALTPPTQAQTVAEVKALARQVNALIKLVALPELADDGPVD